VVVRRREQACFVVIPFEALVSWNLALKRDRGLGADLERRPREDAASDPPIEHLPQQSEIVVDRG